VRDSWKQGGRRKDVSNWPEGLEGDASNLYTWVRSGVKVYGRKKKTVIERQSVRHGNLCELYTKETNAVTEAKGQPDVPREENAETRRTVHRAVSFEERPRRTSRNAKD